LDPISIQIPGLSDEDVVSAINGSRTYSQYCDMIDKAQRGICPFCAEHFDRVKNQIIHGAGAGDRIWHMWKNPYPLAHTSEHIVIAPIHHITHVQEMDTDDWSAFAILVNIATKMLGGCIAMRFGDPHYNAGSIRHLHTNVIQPNGEGNVKVTLAKDTEQVIEALARIQVFEKLRNGGSLISLSLTERDLVKGRM
jgi:hypothetical protein